MRVRDLPFLARRPKVCAGLYLSASTVALAVAEPGAERIGCASETLSDASFIGTVLADLVRRLGAQRARCVLVAAPDTYQLMLIEQPNVPVAELRDAVRWRIQEFLDFPAADAVIDVFPFPEAATRGRSPMIFVVATARARLEAAVSIASEAGLLPICVDITELTLRNLVHRVYPSAEHSIALLRVTPSNGIVNITRGDELFLSRRISAVPRDLDDTPSCPSCPGGAGASPASRSRNRKINENTLEFIDGQLREVEAQLNNVEGNLEQYQKEKTTLNLGQEQSVLFQRVVDFDSEKAKLSIQLKSIDMMYEYLTSNLNDNMAISPSILAEQPDESLSSSFTELFAMQQRRTNLLFSNTSNSPLVKEIDAQISVLKQNILSIVLNLRKTLVNKINSLSGQVGEYQNTIRQMPTTQRGLVNINRNVEIYSKIYEFLLQTRAQTIIAKAAIVADKFVLEPAYETGLIRPIQSKTLLTGIGAGLALALLLIFFKGVFYNYIQTKEDIKSISDLPIIGVVGKSKEGASDYLVVDKYPQSPTSEAFRVIRTNLAYFSPKVPSKVILVTSSIANEGKTFCAINTASILAKARKSVVLLDLDLHKPKQANAFNLNNDVGLTSYIVGRASIKEVIKKTSVENLDVVLTGPRSPNASELILDPMMEQLITELKSKYEYVIIDSPPVGLLSDALVLTKYADLTLFVLKAGFSKKDFVDIAHQIVEKNNVKNLTFILNGVNSKDIPAGYGAGYYA